MTSIRAPRRVFLRGRLVPAIVLAAGLARLGTAAAEEKTPAPGTASTPTPPPVVETTVYGAPPALTPDQLKAFAEVVDDSEAAVRTRLRLEPSLAPTATAAGEARLSRRHKAMTMLIGGITIFAVSDIVGAIVIVTTPGYPFIHSDDTSRVLVGLGIGVAGLGLGAALVVPAIIKLAKPSDVERQARLSYQRTHTTSAASRPSFDPRSSRMMMTAPAGAYVSLPLVGFAF
jgi:hypothetical protein